MTRRSFHATLRPLKKNAEGKRHIAIGARVGYWPCLKATYFHITLLLWHLEVWFGLPGYEET